MSGGDVLGGRLAALLGADAVATAPPGPGEEPLPLAAPDTEEGLAEVLALARAERLAVVPCGLGSKLGWSAPAARADLLLSTRRLAGVVAHEPADGTLAARAGTGMAELREVALSGGHRLTPDVAAAEEATLGGVLAAGQSGWDRLRSGPARHHVLGMRALLADSSVARSGGSLVKNVTGYDLHRLHTGAHGALGIVVEVALRLFPWPELDVVLERDFADRAAALAAARAVLAAPARPVAVCVDAGPDGARVAVHVAGLAEAAEAEAELVLARLGDAAALREGPARGRAATLRDAERAGGRWPDAHVLARPSRLDDALAALDGALGEGATLRIHPGLATVDARLPADAAGPGEQVARWTALRERLAPLGARLRLRAAPADVRRAVHPLGPAGPGADLARRLRDALDPAAVLARGRLASDL